MCNLFANINKSTHFHRIAKCPTISAKQLFRVIAAIVTIAAKLKVRAAMMLIVAGVARTVP